MSTDLRDPGATWKTSKVALTSSAIRRLPSGAELKDTTVPGLSVRAHGSGKSYLLYYRTRGGKVRRPKIGDCDAITLTEARAIARDMLAQVAAGGDPAGQRAAARKEPTLNDLWDRCELEHWHRGKQWDKEAKRIYDRYIRPRHGSDKVTSIGYGEIHKIHASMAAEPFQANRVVAVIGKMLKLAERWEMRPIGSNPCPHIARYREPSRRRYARPDEIAKLGPILDRLAPENPSGVAFLYLLLFSGARPSEIENGTPAMLERLKRVEGEGENTRTVVYGVLRLDDGKTGQRDVFLPPQAMTVIDRLPANRKHLAGRGHLPRKLWERVRDEAGCPDLWARDMRRTFATVGYSTGVDKRVMGNLLGHASPQTTEIYAKLMEDPAHAAAAKTAEAIEKLLASPGTALGD
jgi:integrase